MADRPQQIGFQVTPEEAALFKRCAHRKEMSLSEWIRTQLHHAASETLSFDEISKIMPGQFDHMTEETIDGNNHD